MAKKDQYEEDPDELVDEEEEEEEEDDDLELEEIDIDALDDDFDDDDDADAEEIDDADEEEEELEDEAEEEEEADEDAEESLDVLLAREQGDDEGLVRLDDEPRDGLVSVIETIAPDEFTCTSCFLVKRRAQLADQKKMICFDCA